jgi:hypothetical protein
MTFRFGCVGHPTSFFASLNVIRTLGNFTDLVQQRLTTVSRSVLENYSELRELSKPFAEDMVCAPPPLMKMVEELLADMTKSFNPENRFADGGCSYYYLPCWVFVVQESLASPSVPIGLYSSIPESS